MFSKYGDVQQPSVGRRLLDLRRISIVAVTVIGLIMMMAFGGKAFEDVSASELVLVQTITGERIWYKTQNPWAWQGFGRVLARYPKRGLITFPKPEYSEDGKTIIGADPRLSIAFNDGNARAQIQGVMNYEMPLVDKQLDDIHASYPDTESLVAGLVRPSLTSSIFLTGTLMTSYESYKEKRSLLIQYVEDQTNNGRYTTRSVDREIEEEALDSTGKPIMVKKKVAEILPARDAQNNVIRSEVGQMARFGVKAFGFAIDDIDYENTVDDQIRQQQGITMAVQTSIANAKKAIQDAVTAKAQGDANIATERARREIEKTAAVVAGEQARDVARLKADEAAAYKTEQILRAEADAEYKRRIIVADGALTQKLETIVKINQTWAEAFSNYQGQLVPSVVMGGGQGGTGAGISSVQQFMDVLTANAARDLGLSLKPSVGSVSAVQPTAAPAAGRGAPPPQVAKR